MVIDLGSQPTLPGPEGDLPVVYLSLPYTPDGEGRSAVSSFAANSARAYRVATEVWKAGLVALCPGLNQYMLDGAAPEEFFRKGSLRLLLASDAVASCGRSNGVEFERKYAESAGKPVFVLPDTADGEELRRAVRRMAATVHRLRNGSRAPAYRETAGVRAEAESQVDRRLRLRQRLAELVGRSERGLAEEAELANIRAALRADA